RAHLELVVVAGGTKVLQGRFPEVDVAAIALDVTVGVGQADGAHIVGERRIDIGQVVAVEHDLLHVHFGPAHAQAGNAAEIGPGHPRRTEKLLAPSSRTTRYSKGGGPCCVPSLPLPRWRSRLLAHTRKPSRSRFSARWPSSRASITGTAPRWRATRSTRPAASTSAADACRSS